MKKIIFTIFVLSVFVYLTYSQPKLEEGFESSDSLNLPSGWSKWNNATFPIDPASNWTVRDTGVSLPGLSNATSKAHSGIKACGVSWIAAVDTNGGTSVADAWLVTKRIPNIASNDRLIFWATGGSTNYLDSMQVWVSQIDSIPGDFLTRLGSIVWPRGSTYGQFQQYNYNLSSFAGQTIWIGFRYYCDGTVDGFFVHVDDVFVGNPIGIKPITGDIPRTFALRQNYPNPFNPVTNIEFDLPKSEFVSIVVYNTLGQQVRTLVAEDLKAGSYKVDFDAKDLPSGAYFYRINAGTFTKTSKMILTK